MGRVKHTKDEFLRRSKHVKGERDFVLVAFALKPSKESSHVAHYSGVGRDRLRN